MSEIQNQEQQQEQEDLNESSQERAMATIRRISAITPIEGADMIETAWIDGWSVVVKKDEFEVNDLVVFAEIDSWIPHDLAPFLSKGKEPKEYRGVKGNKLKTVRLRKQLSQGLILPLSVLTVQTESGNYLGDWEQFEGHNVTERLGIQKWEEEIPAVLRGMAKGNFPSFIPKTDQPRIQNLKRNLEKLESTDLFEVTEKMEGSSMTVYLNGDDFGVCSRNVDLKEQEGNAFWDMAKNMMIEEKMRQAKAKEVIGNIAIQGELIGPGIQGNIYGLDRHMFLVYDVWSIDTQKYYNPTVREFICNELQLQHVPIIDWCTEFTSMEDILKKADGKSAIGCMPLREGLVYKQHNGELHFKAISSEYLLAQKD